MQVYVWSVRLYWQRIRKEDCQLVKWRLIVFGCIGLLVILIDQLTKAWIRANLAVGEVSFEAGFFRILRAQNTGAVFGIFKEHTQTIIALAFVGVAVIIFLLFFLRRRWPFLDDMFVLSGIGLVLGGTIGNQIDRVWLGYVTDFLDLSFWPTFNVADSASTVGTIIIVYCLIFRSGLLKSGE
jgi:signal peptidase II